MDSFFKAAVCDLDKLLDDLELNTEELECKPVFLKPSAYPFYSLGSQCLPSEPPSAPLNLPDLSSLHYGSASSLPDGSGSQNHSSADGREVKSQPLTTVDLLSSVDRRPARSSAPPCPDRALKPVCDLVNDTSSAILVRANSHDAFSELDAAEKLMEEEEEALLVDFDSPVVTGPGEQQGWMNRSAESIGDSREEHVSAQKNDLLSHELSGEYSASLSLLDVILPAAVERSSESTGVPQSSATTGTALQEELERTEPLVSNSDSCEAHVSLPVCSVEGVSTSTTNEDTSQKALSRSDTEPPEVVKAETSDGDPVILSCLPLAVSICGALVNPVTTQDDSEQAAKELNASRSTEDGASSVLGAGEDRSWSDQPLQPSDPVAQELVEDRVASEEQHLVLEPPAVGCECTSPSETSEFGFEYLPESDQAELLVTDEELDAFLQAHAEAEQASRASCCSGSAGVNLSEPERDLESRPEADLRTCVSGQEHLEALLCPESDEALHVEGTLNSGAPPALQDSHTLCHDDSEFSSLLGHFSTSNTLQFQHSSSNHQASYGGARPKQPHCQMSRSPPAEEEGKEPPQVFGSATEEINGSKHSETSLTCTSLAQEHSNSFQEHEEYSAGYDELSEPPPYPGEPPTDGVGPMGWRSEGAEELGSRQPSWVPDSEAPNCMNCSQRFTFTRRRHHCRACGKVYCAVCCNKRCKLKYLEKEARVCLICFDSINKASALQRMMSPVGPSPNPNIPSEYCSTIPPLQQARAAGTLNSPPPTVMVPVSVLKHPNNDSCPREQKRVWFADGILPNGEVADTSRLSVTGRRDSQDFGSGTPDQSAPSSAETEGVCGGSSGPEGPGPAEDVRPPVSGPWDYTLLSGISSLVKRVPSLLPNNEDELPPLLIITEEDEAGGVLVEENPAPCQILLLLAEGGPRPLTFVLNANLLVNVKLITYSGRQCWCFGSTGLQALGQKELVFLLECLPDEKVLPKDLFSLYLNIYQEAQKGKFLEELDNVTFTSTFLGSKDHAGMLFFVPTCQPLDGLTLPSQPFLFGLLIQKLEVPWAKVFPLRLLLRLGAEYSVYPTPLISVRFRESVFRETGHTIMNLLADLRNYQYSLSVVEGLRIHMEMGHIYIDIPKSSFSDMQKVVNVSNEHVISIGAHFSTEADSHLVCFQNEEGSYQTQASSMPGKTRTVTGASFVVFNGALKASSGFIAKSSIVEDGLMVQIPPETMESLRSALREQTDFHIPCGRSDGGDVRENVTVRWVDWSSPVNRGKTSGVDGRALDGVPSVRVLQDTDSESDGLTIRCTEVFYQLKTPERSLTSVLSSCSGFQKEIALAACSALTPHLAVLTSAGINSLALRISTQADMVEYQAGCGGRLLPQRYMNELDSALIPVIHGGSASVPQTAMDMEFIFYITHSI